MGVSLGGNWPSLLDHESNVQSTVDIKERTSYGLYPSPFSALKITMKNIGKQKLTSSEAS